MFCYVQFKLMDWKKWSEPTKNVPELVINEWSVVWVESGLSPDESKHYCNVLKYLQSLKHLNWQMEEKIIIKEQK